MFLQHKCCIHYTMHEQQVMLHWTKWTFKFYGKLSLRHANLKNCKPWGACQENLEIMSQTLRFYTVSLIPYSWKIFSKLGRFHIFLFTHYKSYYDAIFKADCVKKLVTLLTTIHLQFNKNLICNTKHWTWSKYRNLSGIAL